MLSEAGAGGVQVDDIAPCSSDEPKFAIRPERRTRPRGGGSRPCLLDDPFSSTEGEHWPGTSRMWTTLPVARTRSRPSAPYTGATSAIGPGETRRAIEVPIGRDEPGQPKDLPLRWMRCLFS